MKQLVYLISLSLTLISCKKDKTPPIDQDEWEYDTLISPDLIPMLFDSASYWIYDNGLVKDTVTLLSVERGEAYLVPKQPAKEVFYVDFSSSQFPNYSELYFSNIISRNWTSSGFIYCANLNVGESIQNAQMLERIDTLIINSQEYYDVVKMKITQDETIANDMYLYYCNYKGMIRKEMLSNDVVTEVWDLVESNVIMYPY